MQSEISVVVLSSDFVEEFITQQKKSVSSVYKHILLLHANAPKLEPPSRILIGPAKLICLIV